MLKLLEDVEIEPEAAKRRPTEGLLECCRADRAEYLCRDVCVCGEDQ